MTEFFKKSGKLFCGAVLDPFGSVSFYLSWCRKVKKKQPIPEINAELTDRQTAGDFIGPSVGRGFKQSNLEQGVTLFERKKIIVNQILLSKLWHIRQIYNSILKYIKKETEKTIYNFLWNYKKMRPPKHLVQLSISKCGLGNLDTDIRLNSLN